MARSSRSAAGVAMIMAAAMWVAPRGAASAAAPAEPALPRYAPVVPGLTLRFPDDFGSHPTFRTEWWYVTGWLTTARGEPLGFQITFFRSKPAADENNPSAFAARQLLIAHCAISDPKHAGLWHDQLIRRAGFGLAEAGVGGYQRLDRSVGASPPVRRRQRGRAATSRSKSTPTSSRSS